MTTDKAYTYCMRRLPTGRLCHNRIQLTDRLCQGCREEGHYPKCKSPVDPCTCGYSELFWEEVRAREPIIWQPGPSSHKPL